MIARPNITETCDVERTQDLGALALALLPATLASTGLWAARSRPIDASQLLFSRASPPLWESRYLFYLIERTIDEGLRLSINLNGKLRRRAGRTQPVCVRRRRRCLRRSA